MRRVAIVGQSPRHRHKAPWGEDCEIWSLNQAYWDAQHNKPAKWMKRWDRWFQIHDEETVKHHRDTDDPHHYEWLKNQDSGRPIYMQEKDPQVPDSVQYPKREIEDALGLKIDHGERRLFSEKERGYYTSTFPYMMALAIYEGFERIEVYGVDAASFTEYAYQKPCIEFWIGVALGRGINVYVPPGCALLDAREYGFDVSQLIDRKTVKRHLRRYRQKEGEWLGKANNLSAELTAQIQSGAEVGEDATDEYFEALALLGTYRGARREMEAVLKDMSNRDHLHYQHFETLRERREQEVQQAQNNANKFNALMMDRLYQAQQNPDKEEQLRKEAEEFSKRMEAEREKGNIYLGAVQASEAVMKEADGRMPMEEFNKWLTKTSPGKLSQNVPDADAETQAISVT